MKVKVVFEKKTCLNYLLSPYLEQILLKLETWLHVRRCILKIKIFIFKNLSGKRCFKGTRNKSFLKIQRLTTEFNQIDFFVQEWDDVFTFKPSSWVQKKKYLITIILLELYIHFLDRAMNSTSYLQPIHQDFEKMVHFLSRKRITRTKNFHWR